MSGQQYINQAWYQPAGEVAKPTKNESAAGSSQLDVPQRAAEIGEPVPVVFARRRDGNGGILVSPAATEARFENPSSSSIVVSYHLVLSEGRLGDIPVKDVFQRACRVGTYSQAYNRRAGSWEPGNYMVAYEGVDVPECPYYCGNGGTYQGMTTMSFVCTHPIAFDYWNRQVHIFIREGLHVVRLEDGVYGPSDSFADLTKWLMQRTARIDESVIDDDALEVADQFLRVNGFSCNCTLSESTSLPDLLTRWAPYFLLCQTNNGGKHGLKSLLPITSAGAIYTGQIFYTYRFDESTILPDSVEVEYIGLADRRPATIQVIWRQPLEDDFGIVRTVEVSYAGTTAADPIESHDLSEFCTTEAHAVKLGAYILSKRFNATHRISFSALPLANLPNVMAGDVVRVSLTRQAVGHQVAQIDEVYQIDRVTKTAGGEVTYAATHFPVDSQGRSRIALDVVAATPTGVLLTSNKTGISCDVNSSTDDSTPDPDPSPDPYPNPTPDPDPFPFPDPDGGGGGGIAIDGGDVVLPLPNPGDVGDGGDAAGSTDEPSNPDDNLDPQTTPPEPQSTRPSGGDTSGGVQPGDQLVVPNPCGPGSHNRTKVFRIRNGVRELISDDNYKAEKIMLPSNIILPGDDIQVAQVCLDGSEVVYPSTKANWVLMDDTRLKWTSQVTVAYTLKPEWQNLWWIPTLTNYYFKEMVSYATPAWRSLEDGKWAFYGKNQARQVVKLWEVPFYWNYGTVDSVYQKGVFVNQNVPDGTRITDLEVDGYPFWQYTE